MLAMAAPAPSQHRGGVGGARLEQKGRCRRVLAMLQDERRRFRQELATIFATSHHTCGHRHRHRWSSCHEDDRGSSASSSSSSVNGRRSYHKPLPRSRARDEDDDSSHRRILNGGHCKTLGSHRRSSCHEDDRGSSASSSSSSVNGRRSYHKPLPRSRARDEDDDSSHRRILNGGHCKTLGSHSVSLASASARSFAELQEGNASSSPADDYGSAWGANASRSSSVNGHGENLDSRSGNLGSHSVCSEALASHSRTLVSHSSHNETLGGHSEALGGHSETLGSHCIHRETLGGHCETLGSHSKTVGSHSETLGSHSKTVSSHSENLGSHSKTVGGHSILSETLVGHSKTLSGHSETLGGHSKTVDSCSETVGGHNEMVGSHRIHSKTLGGHSEILGGHNKTLAASSAHSRTQPQEGKPTPSSSSSASEVDDYGSAWGSSNTSRPSPINGHCRSHPDDGKPLPERGGEDDGGSHSQTLAITATTLPRRSPRRGRRNCGGSVQRTFRITATAVFTGNGGTVALDPCCPLEMNRRAHEITTVDGWNQTLTTPSEVTATTRPLNTPSEANRRTHEITSVDGSNQTLTTPFEAVPLTKPLDGGSKKNTLSLEEQRRRTVPLEAIRDGEEIALTSSECRKSGENIDKSINIQSEASPSQNPTPKSGTQERTEATDADSSSNVIKEPSNNANTNPNPNPNPDANTSPIVPSSPLLQVASSSRDNSLNVDGPLFQRVAGFVEGRAMIPHLHTNSPLVVLSPSAISSRRGIGSNLDSLLSQRMAVRIKCILERLNGKRPLNNGKLHIKACDREWAYADTKHLVKGQPVYIMHSSQKHLIEQKKLHGIADNAMVTNAIPDAELYLQDIMSALAANKESLGNGAYVDGCTMTDIDLNLDHELRGTENPLGDELILELDQAFSDTQQNDQSAADLDGNGEHKICPYKAPSKVECNNVGGNSDNIKPSQSFQNVCESSSGLADETGKQTREVTSCTEFLNTCREKVSSLLAGNKILERKGSRLISDAQMGNRQKLNASPSVQGKSKESLQAAGGNFEKVSSIMSVEDNKAMGAKGANAEPKQSYLDSSVVAAVEAANQVAKTLTKDVTVKVAQSKWKQIAAFEEERTSCARKAVKDLVGDSFDYDSMYQDLKSLQNERKRIESRVKGRPLNPSPRKKEGSLRLTQDEKQKKLKGNDHKLPLVSDGAEPPLGVGAKRQRMLGSHSHEIGSKVLRSINGKRFSVASNSDDFLFTDPSGVNNSFLDAISQWNSQLTSGNRVNLVTLNSGETKHAKNKQSVKEKMFTQEGSKLRSPKRISAPRRKLNSHVWIERMTKGRPSHELKEFQVKGMPKALPLKPSVKRRSVRPPGLIFKAGHMIKWKVKPNSTKEQKSDDNRSAEKMREKDPIKDLILKKVNFSEKVKVKSNLQTRTSSLKKNTKAPDGKKSTTLDGKAEKTGGGKKLTNHRVLENDFQEFFGINESISNVDMEDFLLDKSFVEILDFGTDIHKSALIGQTRITQIENSNENSSVKEKGKEPIDSSIHAENANLEETNAPIAVEGYKKILEKEVLQEELLTMALKSILKGSTSERCLESKLKRSISTLSCSTVTTESPVPLNSESVRINNWSSMPPFVSPQSLPMLLPAYVLPDGQIVNATYAFGNIAHPHQDFSQSPPVRYSLAHATKRPRRVQKQKKRFQGEGSWRVASYQSSSTPSSPLSDDDRHQILLNNALASQLQQNSTDSSVSLSKHGEEDKPHESEEQKKETMEKLDSNAIVLTEDMTHDRPSGENWLHLSDQKGFNQSLKEFHSAETKTTDLPKVTQATETEPMENYKETSTVETDTKDDMYGAIVPLMSSLPRKSVLGARRSSFVQPDDLSWVLIKRALSSSSYSSSSSSTSSTSFEDTTLTSSSTNSSLGEFIETRGSSHVGSETSGRVASEDLLENQAQLRGRSKVSYSTQSEGENGSNGELSPKHAKNSEEGYVSTIEEGEIQSYSKIHSRSLEPGEFHL